ncbi:hypothetical protein HY837_06110 [archaeon]|nr:hypothetical protein [archaeon]
MEKKIDYKIIIDLTPLTIPYDSRLEAIKYQDGTWQFIQIYKTNPEFDILSKTPKTTQETLDFLHKLNDKIILERQGLEKLENNLEFLADAVKR